MTKYNDIPYWVNRRYRKNQREQQKKEKEPKISMNKIAIIALIVFCIGELLIEAWGNQQLFEILRM